MCQGGRVQLGSACQRADDPPLRQGHAAGRDMIAELRRYRLSGAKQGNGQRIIITRGVSHRIRPLPSGRRAGC